MIRKPTSDSVFTAKPLSRNVSQLEFSRVKDLEAVIESQKKEIIKLKQIIAYLQESVHNRENLLERERTEFKALKRIVARGQYRITENNKRVSQTMAQAQHDSIFDEKKLVVYSPSKMPTADQKQKPRLRSPPRMTQFQNSVILGASHNQPIGSITQIDPIQEEKTYDVPQPSQAQIPGEETLKLHNILRMNLSDEEAFLYYNSDASLRFVQALIAEEDKFMGIIQTSGHQKLSFIYDRIARVLTEHKSIFALLLRVKSLIKGAFIITDSMALDVAIENIVAHTIKFLNCDRSSCFIADSSKGELWSKAAKGVNSVIRFPMSRGVAGYVATHKEVVNILNAYSDSRFNKDFDLKTNYRTKTILAAPIMDGNQVLGVLQCINKEDGFFTKEDEALLQILCDFCRIVLKQTMNNDQQILTLNKLRQSIKIGMHMQNGQKQIDQKLFFMQAYKLLKSLLSTSHTRIAVRKGDITYFYDDEGEYHEINTKTGIMNYVIDNNTQLSIFAPSQHKEFCPLIDLDTTLPIVCSPVVYDDNVIASTMISNMKGIAKAGDKDQARIPPIDAEVLEYFNKQLAVALLPFL